MRTSGTTTGMSSHRVRPLPWSIAVASLLLATLWAVQPSGASEHDGACESLAGLDLAEVVSASAELVTTGEAEGFDGLPEFCRVRLTVAEQINIEVWLPTDSYNGRFQGIGGGGYAGSLRYAGMAAALQDGYATAETDTGHSTPGGSFALAEPGQLDWQLIEDFASRSLIQLTDKAHALVDAFYGDDAAYSYWNGCSTGGRQGLMLAQRLPDGYDGILAGAPAINWDRFIPAELWPQVVMQQELGGPIDQCKLALATASAVDHCDGLDGVEDGVIGDPLLCDFDAAMLVGTVTDCGVITAADARVINAIWQGARAQDGSFQWYGLAPGAPLDALAGVVPFPITVDHHRDWIAQDTEFDWTTLDYAGFDQHFEVSQTLFNEVIGTDDPDLAAFRDAGGHVLMWHGWNDQLIFPEGTIDYYERVIDELHGPNQVSRFARLFMAPGVEHCRGGVGPDTFDMFDALVEWVENGQAPDRIIASQVDDGDVVRTRPLCPYPSVARYDGRNDPDNADSFDCKPNHGKWRTPAR